MSTQVTIAKAAAAALAGVIALGACAPTLAQPAGPYTTRTTTGYYYDACKRDQTQRGTVGAVLGGGAGAVIGSNAAARNARTEGALLGGLLGAVIGGDYDRDAYADSAAAQAREDAWREEPVERYRAAERPAEPDGCTLAESPIYMPDGRTQTRFVRVCRDASGKYAVVD
ncbi:glycine zipper 2TM domain-containing protein [Phenylobacterium sp. CCH12-B4]|uniref:glycine zipper 2TM domain-containing protein n=1 Tax=Phenylobacterium sp. CCH12-B4 TaxID=1768784 RepID=UPI00083A723B|nr:glycine zipper 2TM domain-containing protein [Phenylobacterium sp. CCH12-B4]